MKFLKTKKISKFDSKIQISLVSNKTKTSLKSLKNTQFANFFKQMQTSGNSVNKMQNSRNSLKEYKSREIL